MREHGHCLTHNRDFRLDTYGDARHGDGSRCSSGPRLTWSSVDGAGSEAAPDLTDDQAIATAQAENARLTREGNPWGYRYGARTNGGVRLTIPA